MQESSEARFTEILKVLHRHRVDFIIVGGICAVLHGAPIDTFDLDIVHSRSPENVERLLTALLELEGRYRVRPELRPEKSRLLSRGHQLLHTKYGPLDVLGEVGLDSNYEDLLPHTSEVDADEGLVVRMLDLETLIRVKGETARDKDQPALRILRSLLQERT